MKVRAQLLTIIIAALLSGCYDIEEGTADCVVKKIKDFGGCDDRSVGKYEFQGGIVYVMSPGTCGADMGADVFDEECNLLGMLGGFTGNTKINGDEFSTAVFIETVWKKK